MSIFRRLFFHSPKTYIAAVVLNLAFCLIVLLVRGFDRLIFYYDAMTTAGSISILFGLLLLVTYWGAFDIFGYAFSMFKVHLTPDASIRRDKDLYEYKIRKQEERSRKELGFMPFIVVGAVFLILGVII
ncbi:MAG: DUF3899 domain-containing protein [Lachnospiraceae bacterium]|nr:DUF3899 domain-containing protein [Lachnospiraceae bacterium]